LFSPCLARRDNQRSLKSIGRRLIIGTARAESQDRWQQLRQLGDVGGMRRVSLR